MAEHCFENLPLETYLWLSPLKAALLLIALGIGVGFLWFRLSRWWRLLPAMLAVSVVGLLVLEPIQHQQKIWAAKDLLQTSEWRSGARFILQDVPVRIEAFAVDLGSDCSAGFVVDVESGEWDFERSHPSHRQRLQSQITSIEGSEYGMCMARLRLRSSGSEVQDAHSQCYRTLPPLEFFSVSHTSSPGFEMEWCSELDDERYYCEAYGREVALAQGNHF